MKSYYYEDPDTKRYYFFANNGQFFDLIQRSNSFLCLKLIENGLWEGGKNENENKSCETRMKDFNTFIVHKNGYLYEIDTETTEVIFKALFDNFKYFIQYYEDDNLKGYFMQEFISTPSALYRRIDD